MGTPNHFDIAESFVTEELLDSYVEAVGMTGSLDLVLTIDPGTKKIHVNERRELVDGLAGYDISDDLRESLNKPASAHCVTELSFWLLVIVDDNVVALPVSGRRLGKGSQAKN
jgi:hypothetical protein